MDELMKSPDGLKAAADHLSVEPDWLAIQMAQMERASAIAAHQKEVDKARGLVLPDMAYIVWSQDMAAGERVDAEVREGRMTFDAAVTAYGSYARIDGMLRLQEEGYTSREHLLDLWPEQWAAADPDDTDPRFLAMWKEANFYWRGKAIDEDGAAIAIGSVSPDPATTGIIVDPGHPLPEMDPVRIYRGQPEGAPIGISWSLRREVAEGFARGVGVRARIPNPQVLTLDVARRDIIAYLTSRGEDEVIIDPGRYDGMLGYGGRGIPMPGFGLKVITNRGPITRPS